MSGIPVIETFDELCETYLECLDSWQMNVYNIRIMHHDVWQEMTPIKGIIERRAGSRVERQTRIISVGGKADVDYMFEVEGAMVNLEAGQQLYYKNSPNHNAYGRVFATEDFVRSIHNDSVTEKVFEGAFEICDDSGYYLLKPNAFKENVTDYCNFGMQRSQTSRDQSPHLSPSVSGLGALNEYDIVPCLKVAGWPRVADGWTIRPSHSIDKLSRMSITRNTPVFIVPTGNPSSQTSQDEWRLSFSFVEIDVFNRMLPKQRQYYGLVKSVFKKLFSDVDLLSSYHVKTLMMWKLDTLPTEYWLNVGPMDFVKEFVDEIYGAVEREAIPHFFVRDCNIFPRHKCNAKKKKEYKEIVRQSSSRITAEIQSVICHDLQVVGGKLGTESWAIQALQKAQQISMGGVRPSYVSGYLTRLLSVCWYCLLDSKVSEGSIQRPLDRLDHLLTKYQSDANIQRLLPMLRVITCSFRDSWNRKSVTYSPEPLEMCSADKLSTLAHKAFVSYLEKKFSSVQPTLDKMTAHLSAKDGFGITFTKFHTEVDFPLDFVTRHMAERLQSNRVYLEPRILYWHLKIQLSKGNVVEGLMSELFSSVKEASEKEPYAGKLSYRHTGIVLLNGYREYYRESGEQFPLNVDELSNSLRGRQFATNFDLK